MPCGPRARGNPLAPIFSQEQGWGGVCRRADDHARFCLDLAICCRAIIALRVAHALYCICIHLRHSAMNRRAGMIAASTRDRWLDLPDLQRRTGLDDAVRVSGAKTYARGLRYAPLRRDS